MNFILLFAFLLSLLTLAKDLLKGFSQNKIDVYTDIFLVLVTLIPCLFNLVYFLRSDCYHWGIFMCHLHKVFRLDSFDEYFRNRCEEGNWYFCNNEENNWDNNPGCVFFSFQKEMEHHNSQYEKKVFDPVFETRCIITREPSSSRLFLKFDNSFFGGFVDEGLSSWLNDESFLGDVSVFFYSDCATFRHYNMPDYNLYDKSSMECLLSCTQNEFFYNNLRIKFIKDYLKVKYKTGRSKGLFLKMPGGYREKLILKSFMSSNIKYVVKDPCSKAINNKMLHAISVKEILKHLADVEIKLYTLTFDFHRFSDLKVCGLEVCGLEVCNNGIDIEQNFGGFNINEEVCIKTINDLNFDRRVIGQLEGKFGVNLGNFIAEFIIAKFGFCNAKAANFLLTKSSCWRYNQIGPNWQAKRFLCDMNYIFTIAGVPLLTHKDRGLKPTKFVQSLKNSIPRTTRNIERKVASYDREVEINKLDEIRKQDLGNKKLRREVNHLKSRLNGTVTKFKYSSALNKFHNEKTITEFSNAAPEEEDRRFPTPYLDALRKRFSETKTSISLKEKIQKLFVYETYKRSAQNCQKLMSKIQECKKEVEDPKAQCIFSVGDFYTEVNYNKINKERKIAKTNENVLILNNYYESLRNLKEEALEVVNEGCEFIQPEVDQIAKKLFDDRVGFGRNLFNLKCGTNTFSGCKKFLNQKRNFIKAPKSEFLLINEDLISNRLGRSLDLVPTRLPIIYKLARKYKPVYDKRRFYLLKRRNKFLKSFFRKNLGKRKRDSDDVIAPKRPKKFKTSKGLKFNCSKLFKMMNKVKTSKGVDNYLATKEQRLYEANLAADLEISKKFTKKPIVMLGENMLKEEKAANREYWVVRKVSKYQLLVDYEEVEDENYEKESRRKYKELIVDELKFPCIVKDTYYVSERIFKSYKNLTNFKNNPPKAITKNNIVHIVWDKN